MSTTQQHDITPNNWHNHAACKGAPSAGPSGDLFFPTRPKASRPGYCDNCPVTFECLEAAMDARGKVSAYSGLEWRGGKLITGLSCSLRVVK